MTYCAYEVLTMLGVVVFTIGRGSETYVARHIDQLAPGQTVVCSLTPCESPSWTPQAPVFELYTSKYRPVKLLRRVLNATAVGTLQRVDDVRLGWWLTTNGVKVVLCEYLQVAIAVLYICRRLKIPIVAHAHGYDVTVQPRLPGWGENYNQKLRLLDEVVVVSHDMKDKVLRFGVAADNVHIIPCGTTVGNDINTAAKAPKRLRKILAVGRLTAKKGPIFLLEAFRHIRHRIANVELFVIGDGEYREPMRQYLRATGLEGSVHLLGSLPNDEVRRHLRDTDLFLQHSITADNGDEEGVPVAILEAMAEGVPVVATTHAGIPEIVLDGETGFLVAPGDTGRMAQRSIQLLRHDDLRCQYGTAARRYVQGAFTLQRELLLLRQVLSKHWPDCERHSVEAGG